MILGRLKFKRKALKSSMTGGGPCCPVGFSGEGWAGLPTGTPMSGLSASSWAGQFLGEESSSLAKRGEARLAAVWGLRKGRARGLGVPYHLVCKPFTKSLCFRIATRSCTHHCRNMDLLCQAGEGALPPGGQASPLALRPPALRAVL